MSSLTETLAEILRTVDRPGDFFVAGTIDLPTPRLEVDAVGPLALPVLPAQAAQLVAVAQQAPYGRGAETVIDTAVRRTWQIAAERVHIGGKHWPKTLKTILAGVTEGFGLTNPVTAELYKMLVYDKGSFFVSHRDTEKAPGMFATLVLALPSICTGGELLVRHGGREARLDLRCDDPAEAAFAAFYADCVHEVLPVTAGCRVVLVFNLLRGGLGDAPQPPSYDSQEAKIVAALREWVAAKKAGDDQAPEKLIYPLEHAYTQAELSFGALKGADAAVAGTLVAAAPRADCELHLALMSIEESGIAEYVDPGSRRRWRSGNMEFEAGEVTERSAVLKDLRRPDGGASIAAQLPIEDEEISPPDALDDMKPDREHFHEAAGNEGASFDRTYTRAALVVWPRERVLAVLNQNGLGATVPYLGDLADRWAASGTGQDVRLWREAHELAGYIIATWPERRFGDDRAPSPVGRVLEYLKRLGDRERLDGLVAAIAAAGSHAKGDNEALFVALDLFSPGEAAARIEQIVAGTALASPAASSDLLARAVTVKSGALRTELKAAAAKLVAQLPGDPSRLSSARPWQRRPDVPPGMVADVLCALAEIDETQTARAVDHMAAWPMAYGLDAVLIPDMLRLAKSGAARNSASVRRLREACLVHLRGRAAEPLEPPKDWRRNSEVGCRCADCTALSRFLDNPERQTWTFKAVQHARSHVETTILNAHCDVTTATERRGSPHGLVCTKNQASYELRVKQRERDLAEIAVLAT